MIIIEINAGLGNALFQYAFARALSLELHQELKVNYIDTGREFKLDRFNTRFEFASDDECSRLKRRAVSSKIIRRVLRLMGLPAYWNAHNHFDNERIDNTTLQTLTKYKDIYLSGYFAREKYFERIEDILRQEYTLKGPLNKKNMIIHQKISSENSTSIHLRRGDYVGNDYFASIPMKYYEDAVELIKKKVENAKFYIFSDDIHWARENFRIDANVTFVDINSGDTDYMELMLMSACKHNIIANSTFSWWGAWLNQNSSKIVIAPKVWFNNADAQIKYSQMNSLVPKEWIKV